MPISVVTHVLITGDVRKNPIETTMTSSTFMNDNVDNIQRLCQQNEDKQARIRELEERLQQVRIDERTLQSFRGSVEKVRRELEQAIIDMYAHLNLFQEATTIIIENNNQIQTKLTRMLISVKALLTLIDESLKISMHLVNCTNHQK
jgi:vacuolar-type H+-ATPase subunit I/STV1